METLDCRIRRSLRPPVGDITRFRNAPKASRLLHENKSLLQRVQELYNDAPKVPSGKFSITNFAHSHPIVDRVFFRDAFPWAVRGIFFDLEGDFLSIMAYPIRPS